MTDPEKSHKDQDKRENRKTNLAYLRLPLKLFHLHSLLLVELLPLARLLSTELDSLPGKDEKIMVVIKHLCPHTLKSGQFSQNVLKNARSYWISSKSFLLFVKILPICEM